MDQTYHRVRWIHVKELITQKSTKNRNEVIQKFYSKYNTYKIYLLIGKIRDQLQIKDQPSIKNVVFMVKILKIITDWLCVSCASIKVMNVQ